MNYKKGMFKCYTVVTFMQLTAGTVAGDGTTMAMLLPEGGSHRIGLVIAGVWLAVTGLVAFLLSRGLQKSREKKQT
ncbi:MAG: hypothetical protein ACLVGL_05015 [Waltera sp.]